MASIKLSEAIDGFLLSLQARGLSQNTVDDYARTLNLLLAYLPKNPLVSTIERTDVEGFLAFHKARLSVKSLKNYHIGLSSFWTWAQNEKLCKAHIPQGIQMAQPEVRSIEPLSREEVRLLLAAVRRSRSYQAAGIVSGMVDFALPLVERNTAIILLLLDTGMRASELCGANIYHADLRACHITVMGKGRKERRLPFSARTGRALWRYLSTRENRTPEEPLFLSRGGYRLSRDELAHTLTSAGKRVHVTGSHPHRFRHTFAINYLRNGGDVFTLQKMLGHSTMGMCRRYLAIAQVDLEQAHRRASPVDNWKL
jgi:site-specific recombinase XerD